MIRPKRKHPVTIPATEFSCRFRDTPWQGLRPSTRPFLSSVQPVLRLLNSPSAAMEGCAKTIWKSILARLAFDQALLPPLRGRLFYVRRSARAWISSFSACFRSGGSRDSSHSFSQAGTKPAIFLIIVSAAFRGMPAASAKRRKSLRRRLDLLAVHGQGEFLFVLRHEDIDRQQIIGRGQHIDAALRGWSR